MHTLKSKIGQYQKLWQVATTLGRGPRWFPISSSSVNADSEGKEEADAFGLLEANPTSEFYERGREKRYNENAFKNLHFKQKPELYNKERQTDSDKQRSFPGPTEHRRSFDKKQALDKWKKQKGDNIQKLSKNLVEDDKEEEYFKYFSHEPNNGRNIHDGSSHDGETDKNFKRVNLVPTSQSSLENRQFNQLSASHESRLYDGPSPLNEEKLFGTLSSQKDLYEDEEGDEGDERQRNYEAAKLERRHRPAYYGNQMKRLCKEKKLVDAFRILEEEMPSVGAKPDHYCYQVLLNACGRAGYTKKAFQLYNEMKKRGIRPQSVTYTGLFNACAESPWPTTDGLTRAHKLREQLKEKAFGRCGDIKTAFQIVDEMLEQGLLVTTETICFMLQACISDKETGFRHALLVWRKMRELRLEPSVYSYNLLMRCVSSCGAGDPALTSQLLEIGSESKRNTSIKKEKLKKKIEKDNIVSVETNSVLDVSSDESLKIEMNRTSEESLKAENESTGKLEVLAPNYKLERIRKSDDITMELLPNLLGKRITKGCTIGLASLAQREDRLALLGGPAGIFRQMERDKVTPDLATVTQMIDSLPSDIEAEESLLQSMKNIGLTPDTQFCNKLILKRCSRSDIESAKEVLGLMQEHHLFPDLITFGCLAHGCKTLYRALDLLEDMDAAGFRPNLEIFTTLMKHCVRRQDYYFLIRMMQEMNNKNVSPNENLLNILEKARMNARELLLKMESRKGNHQDEDSRRLENAQLFLIKYKSWLKSSGIEPPDHPWAQYRYSKANV